MSIRREFEITYTGIWTTVLVKDRSQMTNVPLFIKALFLLVHLHPHCTEHLLDSDKDQMGSARAHFY